MHYKWRASKILLHFRAINCNMQRQNRGGNDIGGYFFSTGKVRRK